MADAWSISVAPPTGTKYQIAWIDELRSMAASDDGVLVAGKGLAFYGYTPETTEYQAGFVTPPSWKADISEAATATDGTRLMALGNDRRGGSGTSLVRALRDPDGAWKIDETNVPRGASVVRLLWTGERWLTILRRRMPLDATAEGAPKVDGRPIVCERAEIWSSVDGLVWTRSAIPLRAERVPDGMDDRDFHLSAGVGHHVAVLNGALLTAGPDLAWREQAPPVGPDALFIFNVVHADGRFWAEMFGYTMAKLASSVDGREWAVQYAKEGSGMRSPPIVIDGTLRWPTLRDDDELVSAPSSEHFHEIADTTPLQQHEGVPYEAQRLADAPSGMLVAGADHVGIMSRDGQWTPGAWLGTSVRSMASGPREFAVAHRSVQHATWDAPGDLRSELPLFRAALATDGDDLIALGVDAESGRLMFARLAPGGSWKLAPTSLGDDIVPISLATHGGNTTLLAQREVPCTAAIADDRWLRARLEVFESKDGASWTSCAVPLPDIEWGAPYIRAALAVGGGESAGERRTLVAVENVVFVRIGDGAWVEHVLPAKPCARAASEPSVAITAKGEMYWMREPNAPFSSTDGTSWRQWGERDAVDPLLSSWIRSQPLEVGMQRPQRFMQGAAEELFVKPPDLRFTRPDTPTRITLPDGVQQLSNVLWDGWQLIAASDTGLLRSPDGLTFTLDPEEAVPTAEPGIELRIGHTDDAIWIWPKASRSERAVDLLVAKGGRGAPFKSVTPPLIVHEAAFAGKSAVFVGRSVPRGGGAPVTALSIAWTDDLGRSWQASDIPIFKDTLGIVHGSFGWATFGAQANGTEGVAISADLRNWRFEPLPRSESVTPIAFGALKDRFVALVRPNAYLLRPAADYLAWSADGTQWTERMTPAGWFNGTLRGASHALVCTDGYALLIQDNQWLVSRDLERWYLIDGFGDPDGKDPAVGIHDRVAFVSGKMRAGSGQPTAMLLSATLPSDHDLDCLPGIGVPPFEPTKPSPADEWTDALSRWDAMMNSRTQQSVSRQTRLLESRKLLQTWRRINPGPPSDNGYFWAGAVAYRNMLCELGRDNVRASVSLLQVMDDPGGDDGVARSIAAIGKVMNPDSAKALDAALADWRGTGPPAFDNPNPPRNDTLPPTRDPIFDTRAAVQRAAEGSTGAALDLALACQLGAGVMSDAAGGDFWLVVADRDGVIGPRREDYESSDPAVVAAVTKAADAGATFVMMNRVDARTRPGGATPDPAADRADLERAASLGNYEAMVALANLCLFESTDPDEIPLGYSWLQRAAEAGYVPALEKLSWCHELAIGIPRNRRLAAAYMQLAAERGSGPAAKSLAQRYGSGAGVPIDEAVGKQWLARAVERGEKDSDFRWHFDDVSFKPELPFSAEFDVAKRLAQARAGDAAACFDMAEAYDGGYGVVASLHQSMWWQFRAEQLSWTDGSPRENAARGSIFAHSWILQGLDMDDESDAAERRKIVEAGAAAGNLSAMIRLGTDILNGAVEGADRSVGLEWYERAATAGSSKAQVLLALRLGRSDEPSHDPGREYALMAAAGDAGEPSGYCVAALKTLMTPSSDAARAEALRLLLRAAWIPKPVGIDPARDPARFEAQALRLITVAALRGEPRAMHAYAVLVRASAIPAADGVHRSGQVTDTDASGPFSVTPRISSLAWLMAARYRGGALPPLEAYFGNVGDAVLAPFEANAIVWRCVLRREPYDGRQLWHEAASNSTPERSKTATALRALLDRTLDRSLAGDAQYANEIMAVRCMQTLQEAAASHPDLRGFALLARVLGVTTQEGSVTIDDIAKHVVTWPATEMIAGCLRDDAIRLVAALHYYGIGTPRDEAKAAALLLHLTAENLDRGIRAGFVIDGMKSGADRMAIHGYNQALGVRWPE